MLTTALILLASLAVVAVAMTAPVRQLVPVPVKARRRR